jgi:excisionase family DNA binding protein
MSNRLLTLEQACSQVQLSSWAVRRAIADGELRAFKPRGRLRILEDDLIEWLESTLVSANSENRRAYRPRPARASHSFRQHERASNRDRMARSVARGKPQP